jgi:hypothetical protein
MMMVISFRGHQWRFSFEWSILVCLIEEKSKPSWLRSRWAVHGDKNVSTFWKSLVGKETGRTLGRLLELEKELAKKGDMQISVRRDCSMGHSSTGIGNASN